MKIDRKKLWGWSLVVFWLVVDVAFAVDVLFWLLDYSSRYTANERQALAVTFAALSVLWLWSAWIRMVQRVRDAVAA